LTARNVAIDGPAGAGKSTIAKLIANKLGYLYIDTGAMYRAVALIAIEKGVAYDDEVALTKIAQNIKIRLQDGTDGYKVFVDGRDVTKEIRAPQVGAAASPVSAVLGVREALVFQQQQMAKEGKVVMDGRDIGTKVLPDADCKIFLTATLQERAKRRTLELQNKGLDVKMEQVMEEIRQRDQRDSTRINSPLVQAKDAICLDTSELTIEESAQEVFALVQTK